MTHAVQFFICAVMVRTSVPVLTMLGGSKLRPIRVDDGFDAGPERDKHRVSDLGWESIAPNRLSVQPAVASSCLLLTHGAHHPVQGLSSRTHLLSPTQRHF